MIRLLVLKETEKRASPRGVGTGVLCCSVPSPLGPDLLVGRGCAKAWHCFDLLGFLWCQARTRVVRAHGWSLAIVSVFHLPSALYK